MSPLSVRVAYANAKISAQLFADSDPDLEQFSLMCKVLQEASNLGCCAANQANGLEEITPPTFFRDTPELLASWETGIKVARYNEICKAYPGCDVHFKW